MAMRIDRAGRWTLDGEALRLDMAAALMRAPS